MSLRMDETCGPAGGQVLTGRTAAAYRGKPTSRARLGPTSRSEARIAGTLMADKTLAPYGAGVTGGRNQASAGSRSTCW